MASLVEVKKNDLRTRFKHAASAYLQQAANSKDNISKDLIDNLLAILPKGARIGAFRAKADEVSVDELIKLPDYYWTFPRVQGPEILFFHPPSLSDFVRSEWDIEEPHPLKSEKVDISSLDILLVPGVAFDRNLTRLGRGRGFYDRALENFKGLKVGVATGAQIASEELPRDSHDVVMDIVATDRFVLRRYDC